MGTAASTQRSRAVVPSAARISAARAELQHIEALIVADQLAEARERFQALQQVVAVVDSRTTDNPALQAALVEYRSIAARLAELPLAGTLRGNVLRARERQQSSSSLNLPVRRGLRMISGDDDDDDDDEQSEIDIEGEDSDESDDDYQSLDISFGPTSARDPPSDSPPPAAEVPRPKFEPRPAAKTEPAAPAPDAAPSSRQRVALDISGHRLLQIPDKCLGLSNIGSLFANENMIEALPDVWGRLAQTVESLYANGNRLQSVNPSIAQLSQLRELHIEENGINKLPEAIGQLSNLAVLELGSNELSTLPETIGLLTNLRQLSLDDNAFERFPAVILNLVKLEELDLDDNAIEVVPPQIGDLQELRLLYLSSNRIREVPPELAGLTKLASLHLEDNQLATLPGLSTLASLEELALSDNNLRALNPDLGTLPQLRLLELSGNTLETPPPEVVRKGTRAVLSFLQELHRVMAAAQEQQRVSGSPNGHGGPVATLQNGPSPVPGLVIASQSSMPSTPLVASRRSSSTRAGSVVRALMAIGGFGQASAVSAVRARRSRLMFVGQASVGKTSLIRALCGKPFDPESSATDGIHVSDWQTDVHSTGEDKPIRFSIWDFAGQETYYTSHRLFLSESALYCVVWSARHGLSRAALDFWLSSLSIHARGARVVLVATHIDQVQTPVVNLRALRAKYPNLLIVHSIGVSSKSGEGLDQLKAALFKMGMHSHGDEVQLLPRSYIDLEVALQELAAHLDPPVLNTKELVGQAQSVGMDEETLSTAVDYLTAVGSVLYFQFADLCILSPQWLMDMLSSVISARPDGLQSAIVTRQQLEAVWAAYPQDLHPALLVLLESFELCYQIDDEHTLIPSLLSEDDASVDWPAAAGLRGTGNRAAMQQLRFSGAVFPQGMFPLFLVRTRQYTVTRDAKLHSSWPTGCLLVKNGHFARVQVSPSTHTVAIHVRGPSPNNLLAILANTLVSLVGEKFGGLTMERHVACQRCLGSGDETPHLFAIALCSKKAARGKAKIECDKCDFENVLADLLLGVEQQRAVRVKRQVSGEGGAVPPSPSGRAAKDRITSRQASVASLAASPRDMATGGALANSNAEMPMLAAQVAMHLQGGAMVEAALGDALVHKITQQVAAMMESKLGTVQSQIVQSLSEDMELLHRSMLGRFDAQDNLTWQMFVEKATPSVFCVLPAPRGRNWRFNPGNWGREKYHLHLLCEMPNAIHFTDHAGYLLDRPTEFIMKVAPWVAALIGTLRLFFRQTPQALQQYVRQFGQDPLQQFDAMQRSLPTSGATVEGAKDVALRELGQLLRKIDPSHQWGGLTATKLPDGKVAWLCSEHAHRHDEPTSFEVAGRPSGRAKRTGRAGVDAGRREDEDELGILG